jgi:virulence-associated protein VagC
MMRLLGKTIVGTQMDDSRFLAGQNVVEAMENDFEFGVQFTLIFDDGSKLVIAPSKVKDETLVGCIEVPA